MSTAGAPPVEVFIKPLEQGGEYEIRIRRSGAEDVVRKIRLDLEFGKWERKAFNPLELGVEQAGIYEYVGDSSRIDLFLPTDPIACLNWEKLGRSFVCRRTARDYSFRRSPIRGPLQFGLISTIPKNLSTYADLANTITNSATEEEIDLKLINVHDWGNFDREVRPNLFQAMHVIVEAKLSRAGAQAVIGGRSIPLEQVIQKIALPGVRFVFLQDVTENRRATAALRLGAQNLPSNCESSVLLCSAAPSVRFTSEIKGCYGSLIKDELLGQCMAHLAPEYEHGGVSLVAHSGTDRGLALMEDLILRKRQQRQIQRDLSRLGVSTEKVVSTENVVSKNRVYFYETHKSKMVELEASFKDLNVKNDGLILGHLPKRSLISDNLDVSTSFARELVGKDETPLMEIINAQPIIHEAENELKTKIQERIKNAGEDQDRYPAALFYHVDAASETPIPDTETLTWPPPIGVGLEFHFWLDIVRNGISWITEIPSFSKPDRVPYPLTLQVTVWSEDMELESYEQQITLEAIGPTAHARFPIRKLLSAPRQVEIFIFVRHEGSLIAVFRVEAAVTEVVERREGAQTIEHAYLASDWFRFEETPSGSALTIFITKKHGVLQVFTLKPTGRPWAILGPTEAGLYEKNKDIYQEVQLLARRAEQAAKDNKEFKFAKEAKRLAKLGYPLFGDIFLQGVNEDAGAFADQYVRNLPEGSSLSIAIGKDAQNLYIPWGLLYDRQPPYDYFDTPQLQGFLGYRYNLVVRPSIPYEAASPKRKLPIRIGAAWLDHEESASLRKFYKPYEEAQKIVIERIRAEEHSLPVLAKEEFDIIEFFCHGHTKLSGIFTAEEAKQLIESYAKSAHGPQKNSFLMAVEEAGDSLLDLSGGFVTLTGLAESLKTRMPGRPLIFLSMCESAQVSAAGTGFVPLFLRRGARAVIGTEGPTLWSLSREMDTAIIARLLDGQNIGRAFYETRKELAKTNVLALIYTLYGDAGARLL